MRNKKFASQIVLLLLVLSLALPGVLVHAQSQAFATISTPDFSQFPTITTLLDVFDDQGEFVPGLSTTSVTMLENGQKVVPDAVRQLDVPLGVVVAINSGLSLAVRDGLGQARYDKISETITHWAASRPADSADDFSLTWNGGIIASHFLPLAWRNRFDTFDPALRTSKPSLDALAFALDASQNTPLAPGQKKAILFISGKLENSTTSALADLTERAKDNGVRIYVWIVDSAANLAQPGALVLQDIATNTGGRFFNFTGSETLPDPETWFASLRHIYRLEYISQVRAGGNQTLSAQVSKGELTLSTQTTSFNLNVQPPNPAILSAPIEIVRQNPEKPFEIETFIPRQQEISVLIEFPDKFSRKLVRTTLYVDGKKVDENTAAPFDKFIWDLSAYIATADHTLEVEAEDELGLTRKSGATPVKITVTEPPGGIPGLLLRNGNAIIISVIVFAGAVLLFVLFLTGRRRFATLTERRRAAARNLDPVTQPVIVTFEKPGAQRANSFPWLRRKASAPPAYFVKLTPDGQPLSGDPIALNNREMIFGTDPTQATNILDHPSISPLHARLRMNESGAFYIVDQNSVAGTWVNYEPVSRDGCILKHGDMVHFGQFTYRFVLSKPPASFKPIVTSDPITKNDPD